VTGRDSVLMRGHDSLLVDCVFVSEDGKPSVFIAVLTGIREERKLGLERS